MDSFIYRQPVKIWFGEGMYDKIPEILREFGIARAVAVTGPSFASRIRSLRDRVPEVVAAFTEVEPNPQLEDIATIVQIAREVDADAILGIGGGSALDSAKFAAAAVPTGQDVEDLFREPVFHAKPLKILAVPTTAGTGSEVTQVAVISCYTEKKTINHPAFMPLAAVVDPLLTLTVPPTTTMHTGLDALAHALEGYWSRQHQPLSDLTAIEAVRLILENLEAAWRDGRNIQARSNMAYAALLGGLSFANPRTAGCHACSYPLSEDYHLSHGEACAFTLDSFVRINADERLEELARRAGLPGGTAQLAERIRAFKEMAGLALTLDDLGYVNVPKLAADCAAHPLMQNNPVPMDAAKLAEMFEALR